MSRTRKDLIMLLESLGIAYDTESQQTGLYSPKGEFTNYSQVKLPSEYLEMCVKDVESIEVPTLYIKERGIHRRHRQMCFAPVKFTLENYDWEFVGIEKGGIVA